MFLLKYFQPFFTNGEIADQYAGENAFIQLHMPGGVSGVL